METNVSWDDLYMTMVYLVASRSKDSNTHIGAVVVDEDNNVRSVGYNSFARGIKDDVPYRQERPEKYFWFAHAERNACYNAARIGVSLKGCRMYTNGIPCMDCAIAVVQSGIKEVIVDKYWNENNEEKWVEHAERSMVLFDEAGVTLRYYTGKFVPVERFRRGAITKLDEYLYK